MTVFSLFLLTGNLSPVLLIRLLGEAAAIKHAAQTHEGRAPEKWHLQMAYTIVHYHHGR